MGKREHPEDVWDGISWSMVGIASLFTLCVIVCGIRVVILLFKNVQAKAFKITGIIAVILLILNSLSVLANFVVIVYTNWSNMHWLALLSIPWRFFYTVSLLTILIIFLLRLYFVFKGSHYGFSIRIFVALFIAAGFAVFCMFLSSILELTHIANMTTINLLALLASFTYLVCSIITVGMFIKSIFLVCKHVHVP